MQRELGLAYSSNSIALSRRLKQPGQDQRVLIHDSEPCGHWVTTRCNRPRRARTKSVSARNPRRPDMGFVQFAESEYAGRICLYSCTHAVPALMRFTRPAQGRRVADRSLCANAPFSTSDDLHVAMRLRTEADPAGRGTSFMKLRPTPCSCVDYQRTKSFELPSHHDWRVRASPSQRSHCSTQVASLARASVTGPHLRQNLAGNTSLWPAGLAIISMKSFPAARVIKAVSATFYCRFFRQSDSERLSFAPLIGIA